MRHVQLMLPDDPTEDFRTRLFLLSLGNRSSEPSLATISRELYFFNWYPFSLISNGKTLEGNKRISF
jgi:hypothetical protein